MAVPAAVLSLLILSTVIAGFSTLAAVEPTIAHNQLRTAQARAVAEAGVEQALWALSNPTDAQGIPLAFTTAPAPYDGSRPVTVTTSGRAIGAFRVTVSRGAARYERDITAVGWVPGDAPAGALALQKIAVTAINPQLIVGDPPAALVVGADLDVAGPLVVDARADQSCGRKIGALTAGETRLAGAAAIRGATDDNDVPNQVADAGGGAIPSGAADIVTNASGGVLDGFALSGADLDALRVFAKARGTYLRGAVSFDASHRIPEGLVFVDTARGGNVAAGTPASDRASVRIDGPSQADPSGVWSGWLIVNGSLSIGGSAQLRGLVYTQEAQSYRAGGAIGLSGAAVSRNVGAASGSGSASAGDVSIVYDCKDARTGGGKIPGRWALKSGTYREVSGS